MERYKNDKTGNRHFVTITRRVISKDLMLSPPF
jgi:hypothetical protein